ncbi:hypothetical protein NDU88_002089 [Pleurodeles waltl]|uniref:Uncharacterized protein n=1 Tax=Pleurodeles waltl TaxID=8319 RepID=A0AAV7UA00_PLEWA|nr:hypothetical protein NDU88_002089 [Pleurodeles waltl]
MQKPDGRARTTKQRRCGHIRRVERKRPLPPGRNKRSGGSGPAPEHGGRCRPLRSADLPLEIAVSLEEKPLDLGGPGARNPAAPGAYRELE